LLWCLAHSHRSAFWELSDDGRYGSGTLGSRRACLVEGVYGFWRRRIHGPDDEHGSLEVVVEAVVVLGSVLIEGNGEGKSWTS
jgi:hypothetical protein